MTIREAFKNAMNLTKEEIFVLNGDKKATTPILPLPVTYCFKTMALVLYIDAVQRQGKEPDADVLKVLNNDDITSLASLAQFMQLSGYLQWWFDQEAKFADFDEEGNQTQSFWYDTSAIIDSWNEYAHQKRGGR